MTQSVDLRNAEIVPREDYVQVIQRIIDEGKCPFCRENLERHHTKPIIEDGAWIVTENAWPYEGTQRQFLLINRRHIADVNDLMLNEQIAFFAAIKRLANRYGLEGYTLLWRSGATNITGASVSHLHAHVIAGHPRADDAPRITGLVGFGPSPSAE